MICTPQEFNSSPQHGIFLHVFLSRNVVPLALDNPNVTTLITPPHTPPHSIYHTSPHPTTATPTYFFAQSKGLFLIQRSLSCLKLCKIKGNRIILVLPTLSPRFSLPFVFVKPFFTWKGYKNVPFSQCLVKCTVELLVCRNAYLNSRVQYSVHTVHNSVFSTQWLVHIVQCSVHIVQCQATPYSVQSRLYSVQCTVYCIQTVQCPVHFEHCSVHTVQC